MHRAIAALFLFGIAFGYLEAAVVVYLRTLYEPLRRELRPERPAGDLFPLITPAQLRASGAGNVKMLAIELGREAATLCMIASIGFAVARSAQQWAAASLVVFGVWDIAFYAFLKLMIGWPDSLFTWDLLFLLPVPWAGPVLAPIVVSLSMIACGLAVLRGPVRLRALHWAAILAGGFIVIVACCWDFRNTSAGGMPNPFNWPLFWAGEALGVGAFALALRRARRPLTRQDAV